MPSCDAAKEFLIPLDRSSRNNKMRIRNLMSNFANARYDNIGRIREYILMVGQITMTLKELNVPVIGYLLGAVKDSF